jgi:deoxycytidylate deaminase
MTCAKLHVECTIQKGDVMVYGSNYCRNPQDVCPREKGEGYEKCKTICDQVGHAEEVALRLAIEAGIEKGGHATLYGHTYLCRSCQEQLFDAGIATIARGERVGCD